MRNRVSRRDTVELLGELFGGALSAGTVDAILGRTGDALDSAYEELLGHVRGAAAVNVDETGWRLRGKRRTLWGALSSRAAVFRIAPTATSGRRPPCSATTSTVSSGPTAGGPTAASTGSPPALLVAPDPRLQSTLRGTGRPAAVRRAGASTSPADCSTPGTSSRRTATGASCGGRSRRSNASCGRRSSAAREAKRHKLVRGFSKNLLKLWPALWTFTEIDGVEPTENRAERGCVAPSSIAALARSQSERGERTIERLLSVAQTCRLKRRSLFAYLTADARRQRRGDPIPSLV